MTHAAVAGDPALRRAGRLWLLAPAILLILAAIAWGVGWLWLSRQLTSRLDGAAAALAPGGYELSWSERRVEGFPFRLKVVLTDPRFAAADGRALAAPTLEAQAAIYRPTLWVATLPEGLTLERPLVGPTRITGEDIRASFATTQGTPRVSLAGRDLVFTPAGGPILFPLAKAERFEAHLRPHSDGSDEAGLLVRIDGLTAAPGTLLQKMGGDPDGAFRWESVIDKPSAFRGGSWGQAVRRWTDAGGRVRVLPGSASVGDAGAQVSGGVLTVGGDGRLRGELDVALRRGPRALLTLRGVPKVDSAAASAAAAVAEARESADDVAQVKLVFEAGVATIGPVALAPAPKVY